MPFGEIRLLPGINVEKTPTLLEASYAQSQLIRFKDGLAQKYGGFAKYYPFAVTGTPRDLHAWQDLNGTKHVSIGATTQQSLITSGVLADITPQVLTSDFKPFIQATANSTTINITDPNVTNPTTYDAVVFNTPVSAGGAILAGGPFGLQTITGTSSFTINAPTAAATTNTLTISTATAQGTTTIKFASVPSWVTAGMLAVDLTNTTGILANTVVSTTTATTITLSQALSTGGAAAADSIVFTSLPRFTTATASPTVAVEFVAHGLSTSLSNTVNFPLSTTVASATVMGSYTVPPGQVSDANDFNITVSNQANAGTTANMNGGECELVYYIQLGPSAIGQGFGLGGFGSGGFGTGNTQSAQTGTDLTTTDWTEDNWGQILLSCPINGPVFAFDPTSGITNSGIVVTAPLYNGGIFVSVGLQQLICYGSTPIPNPGQSIGLQQDPLFIRYSDLLNYTQFTPLPSNQAGGIRIPTGSVIRCGLSTANQNIIITDIDTWAMNYIGPPLVYGINKIGAGAGAVSSHAIAALRGGVYWMGPSNFYRLGANGVEVIPCPVWDFVFQNLNSSFTQNVRAMPNTPFNEVGWLFPSAASSNGECDSYVKFNITEPNMPWDFGPANTMARSAWMDQSVVGMPISASLTGIVYSQETTNDADGSPMSASFTTGYHVIGTGEDFAFVDLVIPDFKWGTYSGSQNAQVQVSFNVIDFPGDTPTVYGPYTVTQSTEFISTGFRGRQVSVTVASSDLGSFWRLGNIRYRYASAGRR